VATPYLQPFVLSVAEPRRSRDGNIDIYWPADSDAEMSPLIIFVHGGPIPADMRPTPRDWPSYIGYGSLAASHGVVGVTLDHRLFATADYPVAADDLASAVERARALPGVDPGRVALWFFSGGGPLAADWLAEPPPWLRCIAATYPLMAPLPGREDADVRFRPVDAVHKAGRLPILVTRVGRERAEIAATVEAFVTEAEECGAQLTVIDVPEGQHAFDSLDHDESSRVAVRRAMTWVATALRS
jgi:acetyl esterase/lipase